MFVFNSMKSVKELVRAWCLRSSALYSPCTLRASQRELRPVKTVSNQLRVDKVIICSLTFSWHSRDKNWWFLYWLWRPLEVSGVITICLYYCYICEGPVRDQACLPACLTPHSSPSFNFFIPSPADWERLVVWMMSAPIMTLACLPWGLFRASQYRQNVCCMKV